MKFSSSKRSFCSWATLLSAATSLCPRTLVRAESTQVLAIQGHYAFSDVSEMCGTDPNQVSYFPGSPTSVRRRLWLPEEATASQRTFVQAQQREERAETTSRNLEDGTNGDEIPLYRCSCGVIEPEENNNQTVPIYSYCPLDFTCLFFQTENVTAQCVSVPKINATAQLVWPVLWIFVLSFIVVFTMTSYGVAFPKYIRKHYGMGRSRRTPEELEEEESREVDELMAVSRMDSPPPRPSRCRIFKYQHWHYQASILTKARRRWNYYRRERRRQKIQRKMYLKTKAYGLDDASIDEEDSNEELRSFPRGSRDGSNGGAEETKISDTTPTTDDTCSICFAEIKLGEKVGNLDCGHTFHSDCLKTWIETGIRNNCPLCQAPDIARPVDMIVKVS